MKLAHNPIGTDPKSPNGLPYFYPYPQHFSTVLCLSGVLYSDGATHSEFTLVDIPDEWVIMVHGQRPCVGKETGHYYWSRIGFDANKAKIKSEWERQQPTVPFSKVEEFADQFYETLRSGAKKLEKDLNKKLADIAAANRII